MSYVVLIGTFLLIAILLNGSLSDPVNKRIEYPQLLQMIQEDQVARVAIRNNYLVGLKKNTAVAAADFPERAALEVDEQAARALEARERHGTREVSR